MIKRIWHGWTTPENADHYEKLLKEEIFPGIAAKNISGYKSIELLRQRKDQEVEFITIMTFESWDALRQFAGENYTASYVPDKAQQVLSHWDKHSQHYEVRETLVY